MNDWVVLTGRIKRCTASHDGESMSYRDWNVDSKSKNTYHRTNSNKNHQSHTNTHSSHNNDNSNWQESVKIKNSDKKHGTDKSSNLIWLLAPFYFIWIFIKFIFRHPIIVLLPLIIIVSLSYMTFSTETVPITETNMIYENITENETINTKYSFENYLNDVYTAEGKNVKLNGFLSRYVRGDGTAGIYVEVLVDDYGDEIDLIDLSSGEKSLFPENGRTPTIYEVSGVFKRTYKTLELEVNSISNSDRDVSGEKEVTKEVGHEETIIVGYETLPKFPLTRNFILSLLGKEILCSDGTVLKECSGEKPFYCSLDGLDENPTKCGCPDEQRLYKKKCIEIVKCSDGTLEPECSKTKPNKCEGGKLVDKASECGCPKDYRKKGDSCEEIQRCSDGTIYDECSDDKPYYCVYGELVEQATKCGCPYGDVKERDRCVSKYETGEKEITLFYGSSSIKYTTYKGLNDYLKGLDRSISYYTIPPTDKDFIMKALNNDEQKKLLYPLVEEIIQLSSDPEQQAKIAIRMVQSIPYDWDAFTSGDITGKYPYEVLYTNSGVCSEKAQLMVYLLRELGFDVAILRFDIENHDAVGIKCPETYEYENTGYCFVEPTQPTTIGDSYGNYVGVGQLKSSPNVMQIASGNSLKSIR